MQLETAVRLLNEKLGQQQDVTAESMAHLPLPVEVTLQCEQEQPRQ